jgi:leucyl-tRNA---protein transferase
VHAAAEPEPDDPLLAWVDRDELPRTDLHPCPYLPGRMARKKGFLAERLAGDRYHALMDRGFRRSGEFFYAMDCPDCRLCVPIRVPVATFVATKSQRRAVAKNRDISVTATAPNCSPAKFDLYRRYLAHQHPDGAGDESYEQFQSGLYRDVVDSVEVTYTRAGQLLAVSLLDVCRESVSAVYHYYEPAAKDRSLGVFSAVMEIEYTRQLAVPHYYLGYWIAGAKTMAYKANYRPHELLRNRRWERA